MLKLKLQYFGHLMRRADSLGKTLMLRKTEGKRRRGRQKKRWLDSISNSMDMSLSKLQEIVEDRGSWCAAAHGVTKRQTWPSNWATTITSMKTKESHLSITPVTSTVLCAEYTVKGIMILYSLHSKMQRIKIYQDKAGVISILQFIILVTIRNSKIFG